jgi:hypothetical protein
MGRSPPPSVSRLGVIQMKRMTLTLAALLSSALPLSSLVVVALPAPAAAATKIAPADEYFGSLALSILGIRNELHDAALRLEGAPATADSDTFAHTLVVENAVRDWEAKYPADTWLPRTVYALHLVYRKLHGDEARGHVTETAYWLLEKYPQSSEAQLLRAEPLP